MPSSTRLRSFVPPEIIFDNDLQGVQGPCRWEFCAMFIKNCLGLPGLNTRRGLKKVHKQFEDVHERLHRTFNAAKERRYPRVMAGVVGILVKMNIDVILREKLFQLGLLRKVTSLLDYEETRFLALELLLGFTSYEGRSAILILKELAAQNGRLSHLIRANLEAPRVVELAVTAMAHATRPAILASQPADVPTPEEISLRLTHSTIISSLGISANHRPSLLVHALQLLVIPTDRFPEVCKSVPTLAPLLVAFLRSTQIEARAFAMIGILNLSQVGTEPDQHDVQLRHLGDALRGSIPQPLGFADVPPQAFLQSLDNSHSLMLYSSSLEYLMVMAQAARDHDFYALGHRLANLFQESPSIVDSNWEEFEQDAGVQPTSNSPFHLCSDVLPESARALRENGSPSDLVAADVIDIKFLLMRNRLTEAIVYATEVLRREPELAFAHYVVSLGVHPEHSLQAAKQGLQCPDVTPFLREHLLWRAVDLAGRKALTGLMRAGSRGDRILARIEESRALLTSTLEDAEVLIAELPIDTPLRITILGWIIVLMVILRGDELSRTLQELDHVLQQIARTKELATYFGYSVNKTEVYLAWNLIVDIYSSSSEEWGQLVRSYDTLGVGIGHVEPDLYEGVSMWFGRGDIEDPEMGDRSKLARCATCGSPSAALKKCKGCMTARYCDVDCQTADWEEHRGYCQREGHSRTARR